MAITVELTPEIEAREVSHPRHFVMITYKIRSDRLSGKI